MSLPKSYNLTPPAFAPPPPRRRGADPEQFLGGKIGYNVNGQDIEQDTIKDLIQDFVASNAPLTPEVINASDLPQEIKDNLIKRLEAGFVPPLKPDHDDDDIGGGNEIDDAEHDGIKGLIRDFVTTNAPLTPEVINASDLPQEIKDSLIKRLETGFIPPFKPDHDDDDVGGGNEIEDAEHDGIKGLIRDFVTTNAPLTPEVINASDLPQEIKDSLIKRLETGFIPPFKPDHDDDDLFDDHDDLEDAEHDRIKGLIKDFVASNAPLTPEVINASDLPQEIKDNLTKRLEAGFVPPAKPDHDDDGEMDDHTNKGDTTSSITTAIEKSAITSLTAGASLFASDPIVTQSAELRSGDSGRSGFDFSGDGTIDETDTLLMMRHMMGTFPGDAITQGIPGITDVNGLRDKIMKTMEQSSALGGGRLDIDGDGMINPFSDGMMILKHIHGKGIETPGGLPEIPDFIKNPMRDMSQMQNHLEDLIGF